jgi:hypothetical protein
MKPTASSKTNQTPIIGASEKLKKAVKLRHQIPPDGKLFDFSFLKKNLHERKMQKTIKDFTR